HSRGARPDQRGGRVLAVTVGGGEDPARRVEDGGEDAAAKTDRPRPAAFDVYETDMRPAPDEQRRPVERERDDGRARRDRAYGFRVADAPERDTAVLGTGCEEAAVGAPCGPLQPMLPRQCREVSS